MSEEDLSAGSAGAALRKLGETVSRGLSPHPTPEQLVAYCRGELDPDEHEAAASHLAWCPEDADFVLAYREISGLEPAAKEAPASLDAAWNEFRKRRAILPAAPTAPPSGAARRTRSAGRRWLLPAALAASLLAAILSTTLLLTTRIRLAQALAPRPNGAILDLGVTDEERITGTAVKEIRLDSDQASLTVILHPTHESAAGSYEAVLSTGKGKEVWRGPVRAMELGTFHLTFPREILAAGDYTLELRGPSGASGGRRELLDHFLLRIVPSSRMLESGRGRLDGGRGRLQRVGDGFIPSDPA
ncbi:MAG: hypothetical protein M3O15_06895 [Acidobacteriota bacterium]|nr:hypothetical protein [Acidobacteriota bacterium]